MNIVGTPQQINSIQLKNRLFKPALSEQLGDSQHNPKTQMLANLYSTWARGGASLLITGNIMVDRTALGEPSNVVLDEQSDLDTFRVWTRSAKIHGTAIFAQLNHPGKQIPKFLNKSPKAPSAVPMEGSVAGFFGTPTAMTETEILATIDRFATSARLAKQVGFDGIEIHGAHGYLINQFLSAKHNRREDRWQDGTLFLLSVYREIRTAVGSDFPVIIKLNSSDFEKGGFSETDAVAVMKVLEQEGIDAIEISGGTYESQSMTGEDQQDGGYFLNFARSARQQLTVPLLLTGGFQARTEIENALADGLDMIGLGRPMIMHPDIVNEVLDGSDKTYKNRIEAGRFQRFAKLFMLSWWEAQMVRIAQGKQPKPTLSLVRGMWHSLIHVGPKAFLPRRG